MHCHELHYGQNADKTKLYALYTNTSDPSTRRVVLHKYSMIQSLSKPLMDVGLRTKTTLTTLIHDVYLQGLFNTHKGHQVSCLNTLNAMAAVLVLVHLEALQQLHGAGEGQREDMRNICHCFSRIGTDTMTTNPEK